MNLAECTWSHVPAILEIFNESILNSTALYHYVPRAMEDMQAWFAVKQAG
jgi:phosphinothricin acetyltransferase